MKHFEPVDKQVHALGNAGHAVPDYCANCGRPFMEHHNGQCPEED